MPSPLRTLTTAGKLLRQRLEARDTAEAVFQISQVRAELDALREAVGRVESRQIAEGHGLPADADLADRGFKAFSQFGEDGLLRHLVRHVPMPSRRFVEFGVESFREANCRWLLTSRDAGAWAGLVIDGDPLNVADIRSRREGRMFELTAVEAFVTAENIDKLIADNGFGGELGVLSIDIDGVDWWVWRAITSVRPAIVVAEYNSRFGPAAAVTVPYDPAFDRRSADPSLLYFGASLAALERLGRSKGYDLVGTGHAGLNAFFVRSDLRPDALPATTAAQAWRPNGANELHDAAGNRLDLPGDPTERLRVQADIAFSKPLVEVADDAAPGEATRVAPGDVAAWR